MFGAAPSVHRKARYALEAVRSITIAAAQIASSHANEELAAPSAKAFSLKGNEDLGNVA
jgi:hypothetical protein